MNWIPLMLLSPCAVQTTAQAPAPYEPFVAPASDEPAAAMAAGKLPAPFQLELWAAEPLLANAVAFHFDRFGKAYVAETFRLHAGVTDMREHMDWLHDELANTTVRDRVEMYLKFAGDDFHEIYETERDRVKLVIDSDGDGVADTASVFADRFGTAAAGIGAGVLATDDGVYYTCMPELWFLKDRDGNGRADIELPLSTGYGVHVALLGHDLHGLVIGPDQRLYFSCGDRGFNVITKEGTRLYSPHTGAVLRCELDGSNLEVVHDGLRNPQELAFDEYGNLFTGDNNSDGGDQARFVQIVDGADTGWRFHYQYVTKPELRGPWNMEGQWKPWHAEQSAFLLPPIANVTSGPSGLTYYPGTGLSQQYRGHFFLCDFRGAASYSNIIDFPLAPKGAGFELGEVNKFVDGVLATDVDFGPDSNLYVLDWVHGWGMTGKGRIYRVQPADQNERERAQAVQSLLAGDWTARDVDSLRELLEHGDMRVRQAAQFALVTRGSDGRDRLLDAARNSDTLIGRLHGLWGVGISARKDQTQLLRLFELLSDSEAEVRAQAAKVLGDEFRMPAAAQTLGAEFGPRLLAALTEQLDDDAPRAALYSALAAARVASELEGEFPNTAHAAVALLARVGTHDPVLRHAGVMALAASCSSKEPDPLRGVDHGALFREIAASPDAHVRMGACLVARRHNSQAALARFLEDADVRIRREAARAMHEYDAASRVHSSLLAPQLGRADRTDATVQRFALVANWRLGTAEAARRIVDFCADASRPLDSRVEGMQMLSEWANPSAVDPISGVWFPLVQREDEFVRELVLQLGASMATAPDELLRPWLKLVGSFRLRELDPQVTAICNDTARSGKTRGVALHVLEQLFSPQYIGLVQAGVNSEDDDFRAACLEELPRLPSTTSIPVFEAMLQSESVSDRRAVYRALSTCQLQEAADLLAREFNMLQSTYSLQRGSMGLDSTIPKGAELELYRAVRLRLPDLPMSGVLNVDAIGEAELAQVRAEDPQLADFQPEWMLFQMSLEGGDAEAGKQIFEGKAELSCLRCHPHDAGEAPSIGPSMNGIGGRMSRLELLHAIEFPNHTIAAGYDAVSIRMDDGTVLVGRVIKEDESELELLNDRGEVWILEKPLIKERVAALSAMPTNLPNFMTPEEMRDLIEYLSQR